MYIIFCDNDPVQADGFLREFGELLCEHELNVCTDPQFVSDKITNGKKPDIVLMDIDLGTKMNGMDYSELLYKLSPRTKVIFVTAYTDKFVQDVFFKSANVSAFLTKPIQKEYLLNAIAIKKPTDNIHENKLTFQRRGEIISLPESEILYLESDKHYVNIYTEDGEVYSVQGKLSVYESSLSDMFVKCHKSFAVNMNSIKRIDSDGIWIVNDKPIPVSRSFDGNVKRKFLDFLEKK